MIHSIQLEKQTEQPEKHTLQMEKHSRLLMKHSEKFDRQSEELVRLRKESLKREIQQEVLLKEIFSIPGRVADQEGKK